MKRSPIKRGNSTLQPKGTSRAEWLNSSQSKPMSRGTGLKKSVYKLKARKKERKELEIERCQQEAMWEVFKAVWKKRGPYSEVSGVYLGNECRTVYCHHVLPKHQYQELRYEESNIILLTWEEHTTVENDPGRYPEVNRRREELLKKYIH